MVWIPFTKKNSRILSFLLSLRQRRVKIRHTMSYSAVSRCGHGRTRVLSLRVKRGGDSKRIIASYRCDGIASAPVLEFRPQKFWNCVHRNAEIASRKHSRIPPPFLGPANEITRYAPNTNDKIILGEKEGDIGILMTRREMGELTCLEYLKRVSFKFLTPPL